MFEFSKIKMGAAALVSVATFATAAGAETWNFATGYPDASYQTANIRLFAEDVGEATNGDLTIEVHSAGSLFVVGEIKNAVRRGLVPLGEIVLSQLSNEDPIYGADAVPFLATDFDSARELWEAQRPIVEELFAEQGLVVLYAVPWPAQGLWTRNRIDSISDLSGARLRTYTALTEQLATLANMEPTQVTGAEVPQAFATNRVDAMVTSPGFGVAIRAWDFVDHYTAINAWLPKNIVFVNADQFNGLDDETRQAVLTAAQEAEERGFRMAQEDTLNALSVLEENGITVSEPTPELEAALGEIGGTIAADWVAEVGDNAQTLIEAIQ